jgi:DNA-binding transcriptional ArsR family regulator
MAEELLVRVMREIRERKQVARAAYEESQRLERALTALEREASAVEPALAAGRRPRRARARGRSRAAPGANREAIIAVVRERPGVSAGEIAQATGIPRSTIAPTLSRLVAAGAIERVEQPAGGVGFRALGDVGP